MKLNNKQKRQAIVKPIHKILDDWVNGAQIQKRSALEYRKRGVCSYPDWTDFDLGDMIVNGAEYRVKPAPASAAQGDDTLMKNKRKLEKNSELVSVGILNPGSKDKAIPFEVRLIPVSGKLQRSGAANVQYRVKPTPKGLVGARQTA